MAAVSIGPGPGSGDRGADGTDRGQLIIITGLTLAVILVAVVLLLNTAIYTENLATRGVDAGGTEAAEFREASAADVSELLVRTNWSKPDAVDGFGGELDRYGESIADHRTHEGVIARVSGEPTEGTFIAQDEARSFEPTSNYHNGTADGDEWTLVEGTTRTRAYTMDVGIEGDSMNESNVTSDAFRLRVAGDDATDWDLYVYQPSDGDITVRVDGPDGTQTVDQSGESVELNLTAGTVNGEPWEPLSWAAGVEDDADIDDGERNEYAISYANGDTVSGTYEFVVDTPDGAATNGSDSALYSESEDGSPYAVESVYDVHLELRHHTPELRYEDRIRVAPGERDA